jgi:maltooligosyltrehalose trehalohydrolase
MSHIEKRTIGVNFNSQDMAEICLWAPEKKEVAIRFNNKTLPLVKDADGYWKGQTKELTPGDTYKFLIDQKIEVPDPCSLSQPEGVHGLSRAINIQSFEWTDKDWKNLPLKEYIIYEVHTGTFTAEGTFDSMGTKLDYLKDLGITALEIMPVSAFPGNRNWGYDGVYPFAVQESYGGVGALQKLVNLCHNKGIAVILDVVYNHLGPEGNYLDGLAPYFTEKYKTPWGKAINFDDAYCDGVRNYFIENALMWFRDFHIDALRLDAVHAITDFSAEHILQKLRHEVNALIKCTGKDKYIIIESDLNDYRYLAAIDNNGYGMDAQWMDDFHHSLRVTAGENPTGYYSDFKGISDLAISYEKGYVYDGKYSEYRKKHFGRPVKNFSGQQFVVCSQNHDQVGNRMKGERSSTLVSFEMLKLVAGAVMVSPFVPLLFMGEEYGETNPFLYFVSHTDPELAEAVRKGRKAEFLAFQNKGEAPDPMAEATFINSKLQWDLHKKGPNAILLSYYKALIQLRKNHPVLKNMNRKAFKAECDEQSQTLKLTATLEGQILICLMNFSKEKRSMEIPEGMVILVNSADKKWNGLSEITHLTNDTSLNIFAESICILEKRHDIKHV